MFVFTTAARYWKNLTLQYNFFLCIYWNISTISDILVHVESKERLNLFNHKLCLLCGKKQRNTFPKMSNNISDKIHICPVILGCKWNVYAKKRNKHAYNVFIKPSGPKHIIIVPFFLLHVCTTTPETSVNSCAGRITLPLKQNKNRIHVRLMFLVLFWRQVKVKLRTGF